MYTYVGVLCAKCKTYNRHKKLLWSKYSRPVYCIGLLLLSSYHRFSVLFCLDWFYVIISDIFFLPRQRFLSLSLLLYLPQSVALAIPTSRRFIHSMCIFSWVFVGSCHCVVFSLFILLIFILWECFFLSLLELGHQCVFPSPRTFFCRCDIFWKWPICSMYYMYSINQTMILFSSLSRSSLSHTTPSLPLSIVPFIL